MALKVVLSEGGGLVSFTALSSVWSSEAECYMWSLCFLHMCASSWGCEDSSVLSCQGGCGAPFLCGLGVGVLIMKNRPVPWIHVPPPHWHQGPVFMFPPPFSIGSFFFNFSNVSSCSLHLTHLPCPPSQCPPHWVLRLLTDHIPSFHPHPPFPHSPHHLCSPWSRPQSSDPFLHASTPPLCPPITRAHSHALCGNWPWTGLFLFPCF